MKVLVVGSGGREHAICWKISQSPKVDKIYCAPGNAGIAEVAECVDIKAMEFDKFYERAEGYIRKVITKDYDLKKIAALVKSRIEIFPDIAEQIDFFEAVPEYDTAMYCHKKMKTNEENSLEVLREVLPLLEAQEDYSNDALFALLKSYVDEKGVKVGYVMWPIRTAVSGKQSTPGGATEIMEILGKEESVKRIKDGIELLSK